MTYLDAAYHILSQAGQPLHYGEITRRALDEGLITPTGLTPDATMGSRLYTESKQEGARFVRAGRGVFRLIQLHPGGIDAQVRALNAGTRTQLHTLLHTMPAARFEALVMELLFRLGFDESTLIVTPYGGDGGIDVVGVYRAAGLTEINAAVQAKRWKSNVSAPIVTQLRGSLQVHQQGIIITTSDFSKGAYLEAAAPNKSRIGLINGQEMVELLIKHQVGVVEKSLTIVSLDDEWWGEWEPSLVLPVLENEHTQALAPETEQVTAASGDGVTVKRPKPSAFVLFGERYPVTMWKSIVVGVCELLAKRHGAGFEAMAGTLQGRKRKYVADSSTGMVNGEAIPGTSLWVETNLSGPDAVKLARRLLVACGHEGESLSVEVV